MRHTKISFAGRTPWMFSLIAIAAQSAAVFVYIRFSPWNHRFDWRFSLTACLLYAIGMTIVIQIYNRKYLHALGLTDPRHLGLLSNMVNTGLLPEDATLRKAMPAYLMNRKQTLKASRERLPFSLTIISLLCIASIITHAWAYGVCLGLFLVLTTLATRRARETEDKITALEVHLSTGDSGHSTHPAFDPTAPSEAPGMSGLITIGFILLASFIVLNIWASYRWNVTHTYNATDSSHMYSSSKYKFTINFPSSPTAKDNTLRIASIPGDIPTPYTEYEATAYDDTQLFVIYAYDWPHYDADFSIMTNSALKVSLVNAIKSAVQSSGGKVISTKDERIFSGNTLAVEAKFSITQDRRTLVGYSRAFTIANFEYTIITLNTGENAFESFANTFRFTGTSKDTYHPDESGAGSGTNLTVNPGALYDDTPTHNNDVHASDQPNPTITIESGSTGGLQPNNPVYRYTIDDSIPPDPQAVSH